jgi:hypothetical protein
MSKPTPLEEILKLQQQIEALKGGAISELSARRAALQSELKSLDAELEALTGKPAGRRPRATPAIRSVTFQELKDLLLAAPNKALNIRRAGLDATNIRTLANLNPKDLQMGGKGAWPTVTLVR